ncbi:MAG: site-specific integrase [Rhodospirillaceae bacterium]|jgi:integrase|nr:site-specific integrase [Rhodospirillaceae bacterium]
MTKTTKTLTDKTIQNLKAPTGKAQAEVYDRLVPGFGIRVGAKTKTFFLFVRVLRLGAWKPVRIKLGRYPALPLSDARDLAREYSTLAAAGKDPRRAKADAEREMVDASRDTFAASVAAYLAAGSKTGTTRRGGWRRKTLENYTHLLSIFPDWGPLPVSEIDRRMVRAEIERVAAEVGATTANNACRALSAFFSWLVRRDAVDFSPVTGVEPPATVSRGRTLDDEELAAIWGACDGSVMGDMFRLLILTGQRRGEIADLRWDEVDLPNKRIRLSGERTKNGLPHDVPLSPPALEIIEAQLEARVERKEKKPCEFVFTTNGRTPVSGFSKAKAFIDAQLDAESDDDEPLIPDWRLHDFRRTMVTQMNDMGIAPHVVEACVNHVSGSAKAGVAGVYNRAEYLKERTAALNAWAAKVEGLTGNPPEAESNVVPLSASA